jgi:hypothetical protein
MTDKFWDSEDAEGKYIEVLVNTTNGEEYIYWVAINKIPEGADEYDWATEAAVTFHNNNGLSMAEVDDAEAMEPFSREEAEFTFIN